MSEVNDYAKSLLTRRPAGRPKGTARTGSVLAGKKQTRWEASVTASRLVFHKNRWAELFTKPLNKWTPHL